jgi:hypothetical protein
MQSRLNCDSRFSFAAVGGEQNWVGYLPAAGRRESRRRSNRAERWGGNRDSPTDYFAIEPNEI